jgi:tetratricopeptide (TPR) repeat protein
MTVFGQKDELKEAQKNIDAKNYAAALTELDKAEPLIVLDDQKSKAQYYYLKVLALYQNGTNQANADKTAKACRELIDYEKQTKVKYTSSVEEILTKLITTSAEQGSKLYKRATETGSETDYALAAKQFYTVYVLSPTDTSYLDNAALVYNKAKDYEKSSEMYEELLKLNYTGIATTYTATDKEGQEVAYPDEKAMNVQVKLGLVTDPKVEVSESRRNIIFKYLAENYVALDELDKALEVIKKGREEYPDSYELLITQANIEYKKGNTKKFTELLEEAIKLNPTNANLYYNVGVMNLDQKNIDAAMANFKKAIELDPKFVAAYQNMGTAIIDKAIPIVEEMNKNLNDFNKYDELQAQQLEIYKEALPYYEKAYELDSSNIGIIQTLLGLYENLSLSEKAAEMHEIYQELKG